LLKKTLKNWKAIPVFDSVKLKQDFPFLQRELNGSPFVYLNNAATTQKPRQVIDAVSGFYLERHGSVHRGTCEFDLRASQEYDSARKKIAKFVNASEKEVAFTKNTTESLNLLAYSLGAGILKGGEVLVSEMEHHSNLVPWQQLSKRFGFKVKFLPVTESGELDTEKLGELLDKDTKVVSISQCSNVLGTINDVKEIGKAAHDNGSLFIVDGAQSVPHFPVDVKKIGCDFMAFSGHKMLGPAGIGVLYGKPQALESLDPFLFGGDMISQVWLEKTEFEGPPQKFEAGTPNAAGAIGLAAAVDYLNALGMEDVFEHEKKLTEYAFEKLSALDFVEVYGPAPEKKAGVFSFNVKGVHPHDVGTVLDQFGVAVRTGHHCAQPLMRKLKIEGSARMSFYIYNSKEDIDTAVNGLEKTFEAMK
jgi:cysteine desulfurase/selenocysteine lyase